ncbi:MAG: helix-turn-helix transcriptional regulator [Prolixibacteraceae bacterium]|nr:helix-turn-helix transcriptional regulator [Prolixibacteraceae bacterium]
MDAALELFASEGYHVTSISKIADKAHMSKGLLYNYFQSKEELLLEIVDEGFRELINNFDLNNDNILTDDEFDYFINSMFEIIDTKRTFWKLYFSLLLQPSIAKIIESKVMTLYQPMIDIMEKYFAKKKYKNPRIEALMFGSMLDGIGLNYIMNPTLYPVEEVKSYLIEKYKTIK